MWAAMFAFGSKRTWATALHKSAFGGKSGHTDWTRVCLVKNVNAAIGFQPLGYRWHQTSE